MEAGYHACDFSTGNATRPEILQNFWERGLQSGPATLNRFLFKSFTPNWLHEVQQKRLDEMYAKRRRLKAAIDFGTPEQKQRARDALRMMEPRAIDYNLIRNLAELTFESTPLLEAMARDVANKLRIALNDQTSKSKIAVKDGEAEIPFESTTEWSERVRSALMSVIQYSAAIDLLRLPEAVRNSLMRKPIQLSPVSVWRAVNMTTTAGPGVSFFDPRNGEVKFNLIHMNGQDRNGEVVTLLSPIDIELQMTQARDVREARQWADMSEEQKIFNNVVRTALQDYSKSSKEMAAIMALEDDADIDFESTDLNWWSSKTGGRSLQRK
jgi:hypothetical protein